MGFIRKVYSILTAQLLLTVIVAAPLQTMSPAWLMANQWLCLVSMAATVGIVCAMTCVPKLFKEFPTNYILLFVFTLFEAVLVGFVSAAYTAGSVVVCALATVFIFLGMTVYAWNTKSDFTGMGPYLFAALLSLIGFGLVISLLSMFGINIPGANLLYGFCGVLIFTFYIVFDTQLIVGEYHGHKHQFGIDDYVFAALNLYLDIINLFLQLLKLFGEKK